MAQGNEINELVVACLLATDPSSFAEDLLKDDLLSKAGFDSFDPLYTEHSQQLRYLLSHVYKQLQLCTANYPALFTRFLTLLSKHGVSSEVLDQVRREHDSSATSGSVCAPVSAVSTTTTSAQAAIRPAQTTIGSASSISLNQATASSTIRPKNAIDLIREEHVSALTEILATHSHKWHEIGISLNLPRGFLKKLLATLHFNSPEVCLDSVLCEWVSKQHPHAKTPTLKVLKEALASNLVELGKIASDLEQNFYKCITPGGSLQPLDKKPTTLTAPVSCDVPESSAHNVSMQDHLLDRGVGYITTTPKLQEFRKTLTDIYSAQPEVPEDSWPPTDHNSYINLALISRHKAISEFAHYTIHGDIDDVLQDKDIIEYANIFNDLDSEARLFIEGRPGSGKTTLVHKVSRDWAKDELHLKGVQLLFLIHLRYFLSDPEITLHDLIKRYYSDESTANEIVKYAEKCSGEGLCFILDGLDEYAPKKQNTTISNLIQRKVLPKSIVIVASRPSALALFRKVATKRVETLGFFKEEIEQYIKKCQFSSPSKHQGLFSYLQLHPNVMHMCYLPIHTAMVCFLYDKMGSSLPRTETRMYENFTNHTILRALYREEQESDKVFYLKSVDDLCDHDNMLFAQICELAFEKTKSSQQVMKGSEFKFPMGGKDSLGLIIVDRMAGAFGKENLYSFLHLTFQEYLAAYHVAKLSEEEQIEVIDLYGKELSMQVVWKFYCGILKLDDKLAAKFGQLMLYAEDDLFKVQCAFESQQSAICNCIVQSGVDGVLSFDGKFLNQTDFTAIGYVLSNAAFPVTELVIIKCQFGQEGVDALLKEAKEKLSYIKTLRYHGDTCSKEQFKVLGALFNYIPCLQTLDISDTTLGSVKAKVFQQNLPHLKTLKLSENQCSTTVLKRVSSVYKNLQYIQLDSDSINSSVLDDIRQFFGLRVFIQSLAAQSFHLSELILVNSKLDDKDAIILSHELENIKPHTLNISFNDIGDIGAKAIAERISHFPADHLKFLDLSCNEIGDIGAIAIAESIRNFTSCKCHIWNCRITQDGDKVLQAIDKESKSIIIFTSMVIENKPVLLTLVSKLKETPNLLKLCLNLAYEGACELLAEGIQYCTVLQLLALQSSGINDDGAEVLAGSLKCNSLHTLQLDRNNIGDRGAKALARSLKHCNSLHTLELGWNHIGFDGIKTLAESLNYCSNLNILQLSSNQIGECGVEALAEGLKHCNNLKTLQLNNNWIGDNGAKALTEGLNHCSNLHTLHLEENNIGYYGAKALARSLRHCSNLHTLQLERNIIGTGGVKALAKTLKHCSNLHTLQLGWNDIGYDGVNALAESLKHCTSNLHTLQLGWNDIGDDGVKALAESLKHCTSNLHTLQLGGNKIGDGGAKALAENLKHCSNLHTLQLEWNDISDDGVKALAESLKHCSSNLHTLQLGGNKIGDGGVKALAGSLKHCSSNMHTLQLGWNDIGDDGVKALAVSLKHCSSNLHTLQLGVNKIGDGGAKALAKSLRHCINLNTLQLERNNIGVDGVKTLANSLKYCSNLHTLQLDQDDIGVNGVKVLVEHCCRNLHILQLGWNDIGDDDVKSLAENLKHCTSNLHTLQLGVKKIGDGGAKALAESLKHCINLNTLQLERNNIGVDGAKALAESLKHCSNLHTLQLGWNHIGVDGAKALTENLKHCSNLHTLQLEGNNIGVDGVKALAENLKYCISNLHTLQLGVNKIGDGGAKALADSLKNCINLHTLQLEQNIIGTGGAKALAKTLKHCSNLHTLQLGQNDIGYDGVKALAESLKHCTSNLHTLSLQLGGNIIGDCFAKALPESLKHGINLHTLLLEQSTGGVKALAKTLKHCSNLHTLQLRWNDIGDDGVKALAESLNHCSNLHTLQLGWNDICVDSVKALAESLKHCSNLHTLQLGGNKIGDGGAKALAENLKHCCNLHTLQLGWNDIGDDGVKALAESLKHCSNLHTLQWGGNYIRDDSVKALAESLIKALQQSAAAHSSVGME